MTRMEPRTSFRPPTESSHAPATPIIVVGSVRLDAELESSPALRFRAAVDGLAAIGLLGELQRDGATPPMVLLGADAAPEGHLDQLMEAMRRVEPRIRIIGMGTPAHERSALPRVSEPVRWSDIQAAASRATQPAIPDPESRIEPVEAAAVPAAVARPEATADDRLLSFAADEMLLRAILAGDDALGPLRDRLRRAMSPHKIELIPAGPHAAAAPGGGSMHDIVVTIEQQGRRWGWLTGPVAARRELCEAAQWVELWIDLAEEHAQLRHAAFTDSLTGAWNRRYLMRFLAAALERGKERRHSVSVLLFDIDDFKRFNDGYGHAAGDEILIEMARLFNSVIRPTDRVCRIGGDEFAVVFDEPEGPRDPRSRHPESIWEIAHRFQRPVDHQRFPKLGAGARGLLTVSGGLATFPWDSSDPESLLARADQLVLASKRHGKTAIRFGPAGIG